MNIKKIVKYTLIAIPLLFLAKFGIEKVIYNSNKIPDINPHPKEKVRIYGKFPFENDVNMKIAILYINKNPECDYKIWLAGLQFPQVAIKIFPTEIKNQSYASMVDLDYYAPGVCQWEAHEIHAYMESNKKNIKVLGERIARAKKDVIVSWVSNMRELGEDGEIIWESDIEQSEQMGRSRTEYEQFYPKKVRIPSNFRIGAIDRKNLSSSDKAFNLECIKQKPDLNTTFIICNGYDKEKEKNKATSVTGYDWNLNISSLQKEVQFNFTDKGWIK